MKFTAVLALLGLAFSLSLAPATSAQKQDIPKSISGSMAWTLGFAEKGFLSVAEAMPEDKYGYIPTGGNFQGVRSFGEQVKHVACAQLAFFNEIEGKTPPDACERGGHPPPKPKPNYSSIFRTPSTTATKSLPPSLRRTPTTASKAVTPGRTPNSA